MGANKEVGVVVSSSYLRIHGLSLLIVLTMCTTVVVAQEEGRRFLKLGKSKKKVSDDGFEFD